MRAWVMAALAVSALCGRAVGFASTGAVSPASESTTSTSSIIPVPSEAADDCKLYYDVVLHLNNLTETGRGAAGAEVPIYEMAYTVAVESAIDALATVSKFGGCDLTDYKLP